MGTIKFQVQFSMTRTHLEQKVKPRPDMGLLVISGGGGEHRALYRRYRISGVEIGATYSRQYLKIPTPQGTVVALTSQQLRLVRSWYAGAALWG